MSLCHEKCISVFRLDKTLKRIHLFINRWCKKTKKTNKLFDIYKIILDYYNHKMQLMGIGKTNQSEWKIYKKVSNILNQGPSTLSWSKYDQSSDFYMYIINNDKLYITHNKERAYIAGRFPREYKFYLVSIGQFSKHNIIKTMNKINGKQKFYGIGNCQYLNKYLFVDVNLDYKNNKKIKLFKLEYLNCVFRRTNIICISTGKKHTLWLCDTGKLYSGGNNSWGQCGHNPNILFNENNNEIIGVKQINQKNIKNIIDIACGMYHNLIIDNKGTALIFGRYNYNKQTQNDKQIYYDWIARKVNYANKKNQTLMMIKASCGTKNFNVMLSKNGKLFVSDYVLLEFNKNQTFNNIFSCINTKYKEFEKIIFTKISTGKRHIIAFAPPYLYFLGLNDFSQCGHDKKRLYIKKPYRFTEHIKDTCKPDLVSAIAYDKESFVIVETF